MNPSTPSTPKVGIAANNSLASAVDLAITKTDSPKPAVIETQDRIELSQAELENLELGKDRLRKSLAVAGFNIEQSELDRLVALLARRQNGGSLDPIAAAYVEKIERLLFFFCAVNSVNAEALAASTPAEISSAQKKIKSGMEAATAILNDQYIKIAAVEREMGLMLQSRAETSGLITCARRRRELYKGYEAELRGLLKDALKDTNDTQAMTNLMNIYRAGADGPYLLRVIDEWEAEKTAELTAIEAKILEYADAKKVSYLLPADLQPNRGGEQ